MILVQRLSDHSFSMYLLTNWWHGKKTEERKPFLAPLESRIPFYNIFNKHRNLGHEKEGELWERKRNFLYMGAEVTKAQNILLKYTMVTGQIFSVQVV